MPTSISHIRIAYPAEFAEAVHIYLNPIEWQALKQMISRWPEAGKLDGGSDAWRGLDYCGCIFRYTFDSVCGIVRFDSIERVEWIPVQRTGIWARARNFFFR